MASTRVKKKGRIDEKWKFAKGDIPGAESAPFDDADWREVNLPHDWSIEGPVQPDPPAVEGEPPPRGKKLGYLPRGIGWYRKHFSVGREFRDRTVYLEFEGVFRDSTVWVNGRRVGHHPYGTTGVVYDITSSLRCAGAPGGGDGDNVLAVRVDATQSEGWWYEGAGIYRHGWLISAGPLHVPPWGTFVATPNVSKSQAVVRCRTTVVNAEPRARKFRLETLLRNPAGHVVAKAAENVEIGAGTQQEYSQDILVKSPRLWSPDRPNLHSAQTVLHVGRKKADACVTAFGIRWFEFTADRGFFLNGRHVQLRGMCNHQDCGGLGVALPDRAHEKMIEVMKEMGCNILRASHNDVAPALMEACDRLGMLLWAETRYLSPVDQAVPALRALIRRARNHPSIVCWGLANTAGSNTRRPPFYEGDPADDPLTKCLRALNDVAHAEDPTRPTAVALENNADANANGFALVTDIVGYNGGGLSDEKFRSDHAQYPERKMLFSEYSSGRGVRGIYEEQARAPAQMEQYDDGRLLRHAGQYGSIYDLCRQHELEWSRAARCEWLAGGTMWSGIEYRGESPGWPILTSEFGVLDLCRFPKDAFYYYRQEWTTRPMVHLFPHWTWPGREGRPIGVWCYSNCDTVELFLNGRSLGAQPTRPLTHLEWTVPYAPGTLLAVGRRRQRRVARCEIKTAGRPQSIALAPDRDRIRADGSDLGFITIRLQDRAGVFAPTAGNEITVSVAGPGRLIGLESGDPGNHVLPKTDRMAAFNGLLLAIVQSDGRRGRIRVSATGDGLKSASAVLVAL